MRGPVGAALRELAVELVAPLDAHEQADEAHDADCAHEHDQADVENP